MSRSYLSNMESSQRPLTATLLAGAATSQSEQKFGTSNTGSRRRRLIFFAHPTLLVVDGVVETVSQRLSRVFKCQLGEKNEVSKMIEVRPAASCNCSEIPRHKVLHRPRVRIPEAE